MKRSTRVFLNVFIFIAMLTFGCTQKSKEIKIGTILPLTGDMAKFGESFKNGIDLALYELNIDGGIRGTEVQIIYEDDEGNGRQSVAAFRKLITQDKVQCVIGGVMSSTAIPIAPIAEKEKVVIISPTATAPALSKFKNYFFRVQPSDNFEGKVMADFVVKELKAKKVGVLYVNNDWGKGLAEVFKNECTLSGVSISIEETYELGDIDFRSQIAKIKTINPNFLYLLGYLKELSGILRQMRELGLRTRLLSAYSFHDPSLLEIAGDVAENTIFTMPAYDPNSNDPIVARFTEKYKNKYNKKPDMFAAHSYDCMKILSHVMERGAITGPQISEALHNVRGYLGVTGKTTFDDNGDVQKPLRFFTVKNGKFLPLANE